MSIERQLLERTYAAFNARDIDAALAAMHPDVLWPNGMEGGTIRGRDGVREYWKRQWGLVAPSVEPMRFDTDQSGRTVVEVHQVVRDMAGRIIKDQVVHHVYLIEHGLIRGMEIREGK